MAVLFQGFREIRQGLRDLAGDLRGVLGGIERAGIAPDGAEQVAGLLLVQILEMDAVGARIRETLVLPAGAGELGVEIEGMADIADDEKRRPALLRREGVDVALALGVGALEGFVEGGGAALPVAGGDEFRFLQCGSRGWSGSDLSRRGFTPCLVSRTK